LCCAKGRLRERIKIERKKERKKEKKREKIETNTFKQKERDLLNA
jgi:hypothetical protein